MLLPHDSDRSLFKEIDFLANGSKTPSDGDYINSYSEVFDKLKTIFQGKLGYPKFIKDRNLSSASDVISKLDKLTKKKVEQYLRDSYDTIVRKKDQTYSDYVEQTSLELYSAVLGQERVVLSHLASNLSDFKDFQQDNEKRELIDELLLIIKNGTDSQKAFLYVMIGKVLEGSLSQARKSIGGDLAEKIIYVLLDENLLDENNFIIKSQEGSNTGTNTDLVVTTNNGKHCIAVQLSTNDRMRLSTDEYEKNSTNYLVSLNGCTVSKKGLTDISLQRMSTWKKDAIKNNKPIPFYVGHKNFIKELRKNFYQDFFNKFLSHKKYPYGEIPYGISMCGIDPFGTIACLINSYEIKCGASLDERGKCTIDPSKENMCTTYQNNKQVNGCTTSNVISFVEKLNQEQIEKSMYLALWARDCTLSFENFIEKIQNE